MRTYITSLLPLRLRAGVRSVMAVASDPVRRRHLAIRLAGRATGTVPRVSYGRPMPGPRAIVSGGFVKFTRLAPAFPNAPYRFNILYLGSSCMPADPFAELALARRKGAKFVWNQNGVAYPAWTPDWKVINGPMAELLKAADHVFFQSQFCVDTADRYLGPTDAKTEILYNPVDTSAFTPADHDPAPGRLVLLTAGSIEDWYRFEVGARTVAYLRDAGCPVTWLVGGRIAWRQPAELARREAVALIHELHLESCVELLPPYNRADAPAVFRRAHIFMHPQYNDSSPTVVLEAMASGLPVAYSQSGGTPEHVGEAGVGVTTTQSLDQSHPPPPEGLAAAILEINRHRTDYAAVARRRAVEHFGLKRWVDRHRQVFEELVGK